MKDAWNKAMGLPPRDFTENVVEMLEAQQPAARAALDEPIDRSPYPLPGYALSMWLVGGHIHIALTQVDGKGRPHTVRVPLDKCPADGGAGWAFVLDLLKSRERAGRHDPRASTIGTKAAPSHTQVEAWLRKNPRPTPMTAPEARGHKGASKKVAKREANSLDDLGL